MVEIYLYEFVKEETSHERKRMHMREWAVVYSHHHKSAYENKQYEQCTLKKYL